MSNTLVQIKQFLCDVKEGDKPVLNAEFREFWDSLSEKEKEEFKEMDLD